jgi:hypothetical protein
MQTSAWPGCNSGSIARGWINILISDRTVRIETILYSGPGASVLPKKQPARRSTCWLLQSEAEGLGAATKILENPLSIASLIVI